MDCQHYLGALPPEGGNRAIRSNSSPPPGCQATAALFSAGALRRLRDFLSCPWPGCGPARLPGQIHRGLPVAPARRIMPAMTQYIASRTTGLPLDLRQIYRVLQAALGEPGWWPLEHRAGQPGFDAQGYQLQGLPPDFAVQDIWCVFLGAVLTQRSTWSNARRAVQALLAGPGAWPGSLAGLEHDRLASLIRPSGFYNQKARRLQLLERELQALGFFDPQSPCPSRRDLLALPGLGPETADALRVYARLEPGFVSDAYTSRILARLAGWSDPAQADYRTCRQAVLAAWGLDLPDDLPGQTLQEALAAGRSRPAGAELRGFHALLVELAKRNCKTKPVCAGCPLRDQCLTAGV